MNIGTKKFLAKYGLKFAGLYALSFFLLITFFSRFNFQTFRGDLLIERESFTIYLPFTSSFAFAVFILIIFEIYKTMK